MAISDQQTKPPSRTFTPHQFLLGTLSISMYLLMTGCAVYHAGGAKSYDIQASTTEGARIIDTFNVKLLCKAVYGLFWTDFYISQDCIYAIVKTERSNNIPGVPEASESMINDYHHRTRFADRLGLMERTIRYRQIKDEFIQKLGLEPNFSWWNKYGFLLVAVAAFVSLQLFIRTMADEKIGWRQVAFDLFIVGFFILPIVILIRYSGTWL